VVLLTTSFDAEGKLRRTCSILKMRSTDHSKMTHEYEITDLGIKIIPR
jgi:KaiC/GvpD/RAD55 family RecA-like ATPase